MAADKIAGSIIGKVTRRIVLVQLTPETEGPPPSAGSMLLSAESTIKKDDGTLLESL